ncbi:phospholipase D family protein [Gaopeijia maritima]|uniref:phospholipase D family protein n=1 Tax=Gaopeijia maritima TaxID=3119007 RepID=UPI00324B0B0B
MVQYIDSGGRDPESSVGSWLIRESGGIAAVRIQSGFFSHAALAFLKSDLDRLSRDDGIARFLLGSNDGQTLAADVHVAAVALGLPRANAALGIVRFRNGTFFHPKVIHLIRTDGTQCAYVGSANYTEPGIRGIHVEAGVILDQRDGVAAGVLAEIARSIDSWFAGGRLGYHAVDDVASIPPLVERGIIALEVSRQTPRSPNVPQGAEPAPSYPSLAPLVAAPEVDFGTLMPDPEPDDTSDEGGAEPPETDPGDERDAPATVTKAGFPDYLKFSPEHYGVTSGRAALTDVALAHGSAGLLVRLNRDSARHFFGGPGTSNITIPVDTIGTIRFGTFGKHARPRAEFSVALTFRHDGGVVDGGSHSTNVMAYGFADGETGHQDLRMLVPAAAKDLSEAIGRAGMGQPAPNDFAILTWPTSEEPRLALDFLAPNSQIAARAANVFQTAPRRGRTAGPGACYLSAQEINEIRGT